MWGREERTAGVSELSVPQVCTQSLSRADKLKEYGNNTPLAIPNPRCLDEANQTGL